MIIDEIEKDDDFWNKIEPYLKNFFLKCLLPEIIDSRFDRGLSLRTGL